MEVLDDDKGNKAGWHGARARRVGSELVIAAASRCAGGCVRHLGFRSKGQDTLRGCEDVRAACYGCKRIANTQVEHEDITRQNIPMPNVRNIQINRVYWSRNRRSIPISNERIRNTRVQS